MGVLRPREIRAFRDVATWLASTPVFITPDLPANTLPVRGLPRLDPIKKAARTLRSHRELILNWFRAKKEISAAAVEGMNANAKLALRKARGFRTYKVLETVLYHEMGPLPEPACVTHRFC